MYTEGFEFVHTLRTPLPKEFDLSIESFVLFNSSFYFFKSVSYTYCIKIETEFDTLPTTEFDTSPTTTTEQHKKHMKQRTPPRLK
jgi:hypothetical protein